MNKAEIYVTRMRYLKDRRSGRTPAYTQYELYIDSVLIYKRIAGNHFLSVTSFKKWCLRTPKIVELGIMEIKVHKATTYSLGFNAQNL